MLERKGIKARKIFTVYERPAHLLAPHHADRITLDSVAGDDSQPLDGRDLHDGDARVHDRWTVTA